MSKVVIQNKRGKITVINRLTYPEAVNERIYNAIVSGMFESFLPVTIKQKRKETRIECFVQGLQTINQYFTGLVSKKMFLDLAYQIALVIKSCEKNMVSANNLDLQKDRVFIDPITKMVKCVYWPVVNNQRSDPPHLFLKQLPYDVSFSPHEDNSYLEQYSTFFDGYNPFSINSFEKLILKLQGRKTNGGTHTPSVSLSGLPLEHLADSKKAKAEDSEKTNIEYDPFSGGDSGGLPNNDQKVQPSRDYIFCTSCKTKNPNNAFFCCTCGNKLAMAQVNEPHGNDEKKQEEKKGTSDGTTVPGAGTGGTVGMGYDEPEERVFPSLLRSKTGEKYDIDKPVFRIGTEQAYCDLFVSDNNFISRSHADIITRDKRYYVIDRNSTNKTYVDGKVILREAEVEIFDGTVVKLANEEFVFSLER